MKVVLTRSPSNGEHVTLHVHSIDSEIHKHGGCVINIVVSIYEIL